MPLPPNVVILVPCLLGGGAERAALRLAMQLSTSYNVTICNLEDGVDYEVPPNIRRVVVTKLDGKAHPFWKALFFPVQTLRVLFFARRMKTKVLIAFTERSCAVAIFARVFCPRTRFLLSYRNFQSHHLEKEDMNPFFKLIRNSFYRFVIRKSYGPGTEIVALSEATRLDLIQTFGVPSARITTIYNEYDIEEICKTAQERLPGVIEPLFEGKILVTAGRLNKQKGHAYLIRVMQRVVQRDPKVQLVILGKGPLQAELMGLCETFGLSYGNMEDLVKGDYTRSIYFLGFQKNPYMYINRAKIFVFPSLWEGFGNALLEAMACRSVVVAADCKCGPREILMPGSSPLLETEQKIEGDYGVLLPSFTDLEYNHERTEEVVNIWASTITSFFADSAKLDRYSIKSYERALHFGKDSSKGKWIQLTEKN
ncbi:MAG: glycosyltransferase [Oligoflexales bacterium]